MDLRIDSNTLLCGSLARPNRSGVGPALYMSLLAQLGENMVYLAFEPADISSALQGVRSLGLRGVSVSQPFKEAALPFLDKLDEHALKIGAVNTVVNDNGFLVGFNTDWEGALEALAREADIEGMTAAVIGSGGAARAIIYGLLRRHVQVTVFGRNPAKVHQLGVDFGCLIGGQIEAFSSHANYDLVINCTPIGSSAVPGVSPIPDVLDRQAIVFDLVYDPAETTFVATARRLACRVVTGMQMLLLQAVRQIELFTGRRIDRDLRERLLSSADPQRPR